jgi:2-C-methyl-D-erythritol 2,4-cyclodiphosphate synthase
MDNIRIGIGFDVHRFAAGRDLVLGGEKIVHPEGLLGHSDADVLVHSIMDALLGAASLGDIGKLFPDTDGRYRNISSIALLEKVAAILAERNISIINIDSIVICEAPKIAPYTAAMKENISRALGGLATDRIGIKGTTTERLGFTGRGEGIAAQASALIRIS